MTNSRITYFSVVATLTAAAFSAKAMALQINSDIPLDINGFATISGGLSSINQPYQQPESGDITHDLRLNNSQLGLQATAHFNRQLSFVGQLVASYDDDFSANANWAFLRYEIKPNIDVAAGRFRVPAYMYSTTYQVGTVYPWVTPPQEIYYLVPFYNMNGLRATFNNTIDNWNIQTQLYYGYEKDTLTIPLGPATFRGKNISGINWQISHGDWLFHLAYMYLQFSLGQLPQFNPQVQGPIENNTGQFIGLGAQYHRRHFIATSELGERMVNGTMPAYRGGYLTLGYQLGKWLPNITISALRTTNEGKRIGLAPAVNLTSDPFDANQNSLTIGTKYNINSHMDIKLEGQAIDTLGTYGFFAGYKEDHAFNTGVNPPDHPVYLGRIAFDMSF